VQDYSWDAALIPADVAADAAAAAVV